MGETAEEAVLREVFEETGVHYEIDSLAVIHENFFNENSGSLKGLNCHEISFYFLMKSRGTKELHSNSTTYGVKEEMHWIPINDLDKYKAFPSFMKDYSTQLQVPQAPSSPAQAPKNGRHVCQALRQWRY